MVGLLFSSYGFRMSHPIKRELVGGYAVSCSDCDDNLADSFVAHFESVWFQLPQLVRAVCSAHWNRRSACPVIRFQSFSPYKNGVSGGNVRDGGCELRYNADIFPILPSPFRNTVIAHELGHVFLIALREPIHIQACRFEDIMSCEYLTRHLNQLWGFDQSGVDEWLERELCPGIPHLRSTAGEVLMSEDEYKKLVEGLLLRWGKCRGCDNIQTSQSERDRLLQEKEPYFKLGTLSDSEFAALPNQSIDVLEKVAHGLQTLADLRIQQPG
jgi:hypothetical protein